MRAGPSAAQRPGALRPAAQQPAAAHGAQQDDNEALAAAEGDDGVAAPPVKKRRKRRAKQPKRRARGTATGIAPNGGPWLVDIYSSDDSGDPPAAVLRKRRLREAVKYLDKWEGPLPSGLKGGNRASRRAIGVRMLREAGVLGSDAESESSGDEGSDEEKVTLGGKVCAATQCCPVLWLCLRLAVCTDPPFR